MRIHHHFAIATLVLSGGLSHPACTQDPMYDHYAVDEGLPSSRVFQVFSDANKQLWIGTSNGVCRYDSRKFESFGFKEGLSSVDIGMIDQDAEGGMWVATNDGEIFSILTDTILAHPQNPTIANYRHLGVLFKMRVFSPDSILLAFIDSPEYLIVTPDAVTLHAIKGFEDPERPIHRPYDAVVQCFGSFCVGFATGTAGSGKILLTDEDGSVPINSVIGRDLDKPWVLVCERERDTLFITSRTSVSVISGGEEWLHQPIEGSIAYGLARHIDKLFVPTFSNGLAIVSLHADSSDRVRYALPKVRALTINLDYQHGIWLGAESGLYHIPDPDFQQVLPAPDEADMYYVAGDERHLMVSSANSIAYESTDLGSTWQEVERAMLIRKLNVPGYAWALSVAENHQETFLVGRTVDGELTKRAQKGFFMSSSVSGEHWVAADHQEAMLLNAGELEGGLSIYAAKNIAYPKPVVLGDDPELHIAICSKEGLFLWSGGVLHRAPTPAGFNEVDMIAAVQKGDRLYVATRGAGIITYRQQGDSLRVMAVNTELTSSYNFLRDFGDFLLAGFESGLALIRMEQKGLTFANIHASHGLPRVSVRDVMLVRDRFYLTTSNGVQIIPVRKLWTDAQPIPVHINDVFLNNQPLDAALPDMQIEFFKGLLSFEVRSIDYHHSSAANFEYRLLPLDTLWRPSEVSRVQFSSLAPGDYRFEVRTLSGGHVVGDDVRFTIVPMFGQTIWFKLIIALLVALAVGLPVFFLVRERYLRHKFEVDIGRLRLNNISSQMNPHFIFNSLSSIHGFIMSNERRESGKYLSRFSMLIRRILDNSMHMLIPWKYTLETLELYIQLEKMRFADKFRFTRSIPDEPWVEHLLLPPMLVQPFVENAILHGIVPKKGVGKLSLTMSRENGFVEIRIIDDGIGCKKAREMRERANKTRFSYGTELSLERVKLYNRMLKTNIELHISALDPVHDTGTVVCLRIPSVPPFVPD